MEQASASKTVTEVRTASFKPVVDDVVVDDPIFGQTISLNACEITGFSVVHLHANIKIMALRNQWCSWRMSHIAGIVL